MKEVAGKPRLKKIKFMVVLRPIKENAF